MKTSLSNWIALMESLHLEANEATFDYLLAKYGEKHRFYHNIQHIEDCLRNVSIVESDTKELELAIWFHDVIYNSYGKDNELKSAEKLKAFLSGKMSDELQITRIYDLIMITKHDQVPKTEDEKWIVDIDISILGKSKDIYFTYAEAIRKEYRLIPTFYYKRKRKEILTAFLKKQRLYHTDHYFKLYEDQARSNITLEIEKLS